MTYTSFIYSVLQKRNKRMASIKVTPEQKVNAAIRLKELEEMKLTPFHVEQNQEKRNCLAIINS